MIRQLADVLSFRRIAGIPFDVYLAALDSWGLTGRDGELRLGHSLLRGPIECDHHLGTCRIGVQAPPGALPDRRPRSRRHPAPSRPHRRRTPANRRRRHPRVTGTKPMPPANGVTDPGVG